MYTIQACSRREVVLVVFNDSKPESYGRKNGFEKRKSSALLECDAKVTREERFISSIRSRILVLFPEESFYDGNRV
jgi:hypothetical protein